MELRSIYSSLKPNKIIWLLTLSDIFTWGAWSVVNVISGIYLAGKLGEDAVKLVGIGTAIYYFTRAVFQVPFGIITDRIKKQNDEAFLLGFGSMLMGFPFVLYPLISSSSMYFVLQFIFGLGTSMNLIAWRKLFATNLDDDREGRAYGVYGVIMSFSIAIFSSIAGIIANISSQLFDMVMVFTGTVMITGSFWALLIFRIKSRAKQSR